MRIGKLPQKKGKGKFPLFFGIRERVISFYAVNEKGIYFGNIYFL